MLTLLHSCPHDDTLKWTGGPVWLRYWVGPPTLWSSINLGPTIMILVIRSTSLIQSIQFPPCSMIYQVNNWHANKQSMFSKTHRKLEIVPIAKLRYIYKWLSYRSLKDGITEFKSKEFSYAGLKKIKSLATDLFFFSCWMLTAFYRYTHYYTAILWELFVSEVFDQMISLELLIVPLATQMYSNYKLKDIGLLIIQAFCVLFSSMKPFWIGRFFFFSFLI